ncbi:transposase [Cupriavidus taiwanensis]|uniref:Transposase n=1 Tax=Cupriavidus taiwanensis TaxID=164546 RepID=A0A9Q7UQU9_9BURK|nr:TniB family NTP-binding protein [Cupriavidus taiwanensis]SPD63004.1 transposase [Cupriavidus taiwanensis]
MDSIYSILERFNEDLLQFPAYVAAFNDIEGLLRLHRETGVAQHLLVLGESGTGKTTLCQDFVTRYPRVVLAERDVVPVLHVTIPPVATIAGVTEAMLARLGDPSPTTGTVSSKTARAVKLARAVSVELLLIDEAQHIQDRGKLPTQYLVGDWLKTVMDEIGVPTVLLGLPRVGNLLQVNEQVRRRFSRRRYLQMGQHGETSVEEECLQLFLSLGDNFPIPVSCGSVGWKEMAQRVYYACDGRVAYIKKLLSGAIRIALEQQLPHVGLETLEAAFTREVWWEGIDQLNPFNEQFQFRRLIQPNEPFEQALAAPSRIRAKERRDCL